MMVNWSATRIQQSDILSFVILYLKKWCKDMVFCDFFMPYYNWKNDVNVPYLQKVPVINKNLDKK